MILDGSKDAVVVVNERFFFAIFPLITIRLYVEIFNPSAENLFGVNVDEVLGQHAGKLLPVTTISELQARIKNGQQKKLKGARAHQKEVVLPMEDEETIIINKSTRQSYF